jgi:hypothetical protein
MYEVLGGSYDEIRRSYAALGSGHGYEAHHVYGWASYSEVLGITRGEGPSIRMIGPDHKETASYIKTTASIEYRKHQSSFLSGGDYQSAWMMDVSDIRGKFGNKYDQHLAQAERQLLSLDREGKLQLEQKFKLELAERQKVREGLEAAQRAKDESIHGD